MTLCGWGKQGKDSNMRRGRGYVTERTVVVGILSGGLVGHVTGIVRAVGV